MKKILLAAIIFISALSTAYSQCTKPTVSIAEPSPVSICEGQAHTLSGSVSVSGASQNGGFTYSWKKVLPTPVVDLTPPTAITLLENTTLSVPDYNGITGFPVDAGTYVLRVEDGNAGNSACYAEASVVIIVNPKPTITSAATGTACSGVAQNYAITNNVASSYAWTRAAVTGISNMSGTGTTNPITETLINTTADPIIVRYIITPTSAANCVGTPFNYDVTVTPAVIPAVALNANKTTICSGEAVIFTATPEHGGTDPMYQWFKGTPGSGTIIQSATNATYTTTTAANNDSYYVIMTSNAACASPATATSNAIVLTVASVVVPSVTIIASPSTICTNGAATFTATPGNGGTAPIYEWSINNVSQGAASFNSTFTTTALTSSSDVVRVTLTSNSACVVAPGKVDATTSVTVNPGIGGGTIGTAATTICYNTIPTAITELTAPVNIAGTPTYKWEVSVTGNLGSFSAIPGATNASFTPTIPITHDVYIKRETTDPGTSAPCNVAYSNVVKITVASAYDPGTITGNETICKGDDVTRIENETNESGGISQGAGYIWQASSDGASNWTNITGATNAQYLPWKITQTTYYRRQTFNYCSYLNPNSNTIIKEVLDDCGTFSSTISGQNPITAGQQNAVYSVPDQTGFTYSWTVTGGTIVSGENTNAVTVNWDAASTFARTTADSYSISVLETNASNQTKTTTVTINTITTGVTQSQAQAGINVFPNPTTGSFNIVMPESGMDVTYEILDVTGISVASGAFTSTGNDQHIETNFGAGMYQVVLKYNNVVTCARLSKIQ